MTEENPGFSGIHHVTLTVTDLERSTEWYVRVLGLAKGWEMPDVEGRGQKVALLHPDSSLRIVLAKHQASQGEAASEYRTGLDHLAFSVPDRPSLEAWSRRFDELGIPHSPIKEGATGWLIVFRDPDNIQLEMYTQTK